MSGIIWLWKHRHCWEQLKYLYEHRYSLKLILSKVSLHPDAPEKVERILACLREFDRMPLAKPMMRGMRLPEKQEGERSPFLTEDGQLKRGIVYPTQPIPRCKDRPTPKQRDGEIAHTLVE